jgi:hypothetical protein
MPPRRQQTDAQRAKLDLLRPHATRVETSRPNLRGGEQGAYSGATWAPVPAALGHGFRNDAGAHSGSIWALIPA